MTNQSNRNADVAFRTSILLHDAYASGIPHEDEVRSHL